MICSWSPLVLGLEVFGRGKDVSQGQPLLLCQSWGHLVKAIAQAGHCLCEACGPWGPLPEVSHCSSGTCRSLDKSIVQAKADCHSCGLERLEEALANKRLVRWDLRETPGQGKSFWLG